MPSAQQTELFDKLTADLAAFESIATDEVICPLCWKRFSRTALDNPGPEGLSIEHIVPEALGGREVTLTCRRCNNEQGSSHDAHVVRKVKAEDWLLGDGSTRNGKMLFAGKEVGVKITWSDGTGPTTISLAGGRPEELQQLWSSIGQSIEGDGFNLTSPLRYEESNAGRGMLRMAYLAMFKKLGYSYIATLAGERIRELILTGEDNEMQSFILRLGNPQECDLADTFGVLDLRIAGRNLAWIPILRFETVRVRYQAILMPGTDLLNDASFLSKLEDINSLLPQLRPRFEDDDPMQKQ